MPLVLLAGGCPRVVMTGEQLDLESDGCPALPIGELVAQAGTYYINTPTRDIACALDKLRKHADEPDVARVATRVAFLLAERQTDGGRREKLAAEGLRWAELAELQGSDDATVQYYLALNLGLAVRNHTALAMKNLKRLEKTLQRVVELDAGIDYGGPLRLLGTLYLLAPPWPKGIGDIDKALELLERAVRDYPEHPLNHVFYARALWEAEEDDARKQVAKHLMRARGLLEQAMWRGARGRWMEELRQVEEETGIRPPAKPTTPPAAGETDRQP